jgi:hypothetical protein
MAMGKLLEVWLRLLERGRWYLYPNYSEEDGPMLRPTVDSTGVVKMVDMVGKKVDTVDHDLKLYQQRYEEDQDPDPFTDRVVNLMRALTTALANDRPIPEWVISGLNSDKRLQKYRPFPKNEKIEFLSSKEVMGQWDIDDPVKMARHIWNDGLGYYVISGKWMSEVAQAIREKEIITYKGNRVNLIANGWTWVDDGEITFDKIFENLDDLAFSLKDVVEFEKEHGLAVNHEVQGKALSNSLVQHETEISPDKQYVFKKTGPGWIIHFDGEIIGPVKHFGYGYFYYCIKNQSKEFTDDELEQAVKRMMPAEFKNLPIDPEYDEDSTKKFPGYQIGSLTMIETRQDRSDHKAIIDALHESEDLKERIAEAKRNNDKGIDILESELANIEDYLSECTSQGKLKAFPDQKTKVSNRVGKAMSRALEDLALHSKAAHAHFKQAFGHLFTPTKRYRPTEIPPWTLE